MLKYLSSLASNASTNVFSVDDIDDKSTESFLDEKVNTIVHLSNSTATQNLSSSDKKDLVNSVKNIIRFIEVLDSKSVPHEVIIDFKHRCLGALLKFFGAQTVQKKCLLGSLPVFLKNMDVHDELHFSLTWTFMYSTISSISEESLKILICNNMEKIGYYSILLEFIGKNLSSRDSFYVIALILDHLLWICSRPSSLLSTASSLPVRVKQYLLLPRHLESIFELVRWTDDIESRQSAGHALSILVLLLTSVDKSTCTTIQDVARLSGGLLWIFHRLTWNLQSSFVLGHIDDYSSAAPKVAAPQFVRSVFGSMSPEPDALTESAASSNVQSLFMLLCMGNSNNTQMVIRVLPLGMQMFLAQIPAAGYGLDHLFATAPPLSEAVSSFATKMDSWLRWNVLLAALATRLDSPCVVWTQHALVHLTDQLQAAMVAHDQTRRLRTRRHQWDPLLLDVTYPMLDVLLPVSGVYVRVLLQDLERDHAESESEREQTGRPGYFPEANVAAIAVTTMDRALLAAMHVDERGTDDEEEEVVLLCLRSLVLMLYRWPREVQRALPLGGFVILLKTGVRRCSLRVGENGGTTPHSVLWLRRVMLVLRLRLSAMGVEDVQQFRFMGGVEAWLRAVESPVAWTGLGKGTSTGSEAAHELLLALHFLLEVVTLSSAVASRLCSPSPAQAIVRSLWQAGELSGTGSGSAMEALESVLRRMILVDPQGATVALSQTEVVAVLLYRYVKGDGIGELGMVSAELLVELLHLALGVGDAFATATDRVKEAYLAVTAASSPLMLMFVSMLPTQLLRMMLLLPTTDLPALFNGYVRSPDVIWDARRRLRCQAKALERVRTWLNIVPLSGTAETASGPVYPELSSEPQVSGMYLRYLAVPSACVCKPWSTWFTAPVDLVSLVTALLSEISSQASASGSALVLSGLSSVGLKSDSFPAQTAGLSVLVFEVVSQVSRRLAAEFGSYSLDVSHEAVPHADNRTEEAADVPSTDPAEACNDGACVTENKQAAVITNPKNRSPDQWVELAAGIVCLAVWLRLPAELNMGKPCSVFSALSLPDLRESDTRLPVVDVARVLDLVVSVGLAAVESLEQTGEADDTPLVASKSLLAVLTVALVAVTETTAEGRMRSDKPRSDLLHWLLGRPCVALLCRCCHKCVARRSPQSALCALVALQLLLQHSQRLSLELGLAQELFEAGVPVLLLDNIVAFSAQPSPSTKYTRWAALSMLNSESVGSQKDGELQAPTVPERCESLLDMLQQDVGAFLLDSCKGQPAPSNPSSDPRSVDSCTEVATECVHLLRLLVGDCRSSGDSAAAATPATPTINLLQQLLPPPLLVTLLTEPEVGISILGSRAEVRRPIGMWRPEMRSQLETLLGSEAKVGAVPNIQQLLASNRFQCLYPALADEVTVDGLYINLLLDPSKTDDIGSRSPPRFVEALQASLAGSRRLMQHLSATATGSGSRRQGNLDTVAKLTKLKQSVLECVLQKHPELGYSDAVVDDD